VLKPHERLSPRGGLYYIIIEIAVFINFQPNRPRSAIPQHVTYFMLHTSYFMSILTATGDVAVSSRTIQATPVSAAYLRKGRNNTDLFIRKPHGERFLDASHL
jgi:hypothetical protein